MRIQLTKDQLELVVLKSGEMRMTWVALRPRESGVGVGVSLYLSFKCKLI